MKDSDECLKMINYTTKEKAKEWEYWIEKHKWLFNLIVSVLLLVIITFLIFLGEIAAAVTGISAIAIFWRLRQDGQLATTEFEDKLNREYRELARDIPAKALLHDKLGPDEYIENFDNLLYYLDLCNEQAFLRHEGRVSRESWNSWREGIESNLESPTFERAWSEVKDRSEHYSELRRTLCEDCSDDPREWNDPNELCSECDDEDSKSDNSDEKSEP